MYKSTQDIFNIHPVFCQPYVQQQVHLNFSSYDFLFSIFIVKHRENTFHLAKNIRNELKAAYQVLQLQGNDFRKINRSRPWIEAAIY